MPTEKEDLWPAKFDEYQAQRENLTEYERLQALEEKRRLELEEIESRIFHDDLPDINEKAALEVATEYAKGHHANRGYGHLGRAYLRVLRDHEPLKAQHEGLNEEFACTLDKMGELQSRLGDLTDDVLALDVKVQNQKSEIEYLNRKLQKRGEGGNRVAIALAELDSDVTLTLHVDPSESLKLVVSRPTEGKKRTQVALAIPKADRFSHINPDNLIAGQLLHGLESTKRVVERYRQAVEQDRNRKLRQAQRTTVTNLKATVKAFNASIQKGSQIPASILFGGKNEDD